MTPPMTPPPDTLTLKAAAEHAGVSVSTIRRRKDALVAAGATVEPSGWAIPLRALELVFGLSNETPSAPSSDSELLAQLRSENEFLRRQVERQAKQIEQQVEQQARTVERQAEAHAVISAQLARLGQLEQPSASEPESASASSPGRSRRRWWPFGGR